MSRTRTLIVSAAALAVAGGAAALSAWAPTAIGGGMGSEFRSPMAIAGVEKMSLARFSLARLFRRGEGAPVLAPVGSAEEAVPARVVDG